MNKTLIAVLGTACIAAPASAELIEYTFGGSFTAYSLSSTAMPERFEVTYTIDTDAMTNISTTGTRAIWAGTAVVDVEAAFDGVEVDLPDISQYASVHTTLIVNQVIADDPSGVSTEDFYFDFSVAGSTSFVAFAEFSVFGSVAVNGIADPVPSLGLDGLPTTSDALDPSHFDSYGGDLNYILPPNPDLFVVSTPNSDTLVVDTVSIRIVPSPSTVGAIALSGLLATRRRRTA